MELSKSFLALILSFSLGLIGFLAIPFHTTTAQEQKVALQRGYRTGYSDGYMAGYRDILDNQDKSYARHTDYADASRAYNKDYGTPEDYRDGYKQGFENGYDSGFAKNTFDATIPDHLAFRGEVANVMPAATAPVAEAPVAEAPAIQTPVETPTAPVADTVMAPPAPADDTIQKASFKPVSDAVIIIPRDTELIVELADSLSTDRNSTGDKFTAKIISPSEIAGAVVEGRVDKITKPGRLTRRSQMLLSFDRIVLNEQRWSNFDAMLIEVMAVKGDNVKRVDNEGNAVGKGTLKGDTVKIGGSTGVGAGIGALAGGPVGAAVGAGVGAAFGVGAVVIDRGKNIRLNQAQQLRIKTSYETQIR
jgi:hypothetical protein